jgi:hypothetical protein
VRAALSVDTAQALLRKKSWARRRNSWVYNLILLALVDSPFTCEGCNICASSAASGRYEQSANGFVLIAHESNKFVDLDQHRLPRDQHYADQKLRLAIQSTQIDKLHTIGKPLDQRLGLPPEISL